MKGYFACPLASNREREMAAQLVDFIEAQGHEVLDRHVVAKGFSSDGDESEMSKIFSEKSGLP